MIIFVSTLVVNKDYKSYSLKEYNGQSQPISEGTNPTLARGILDLVSNNVVICYPTLVSDPKNQNDWLPLIPTMF